MGTVRKFVTLQYWRDDLFFFLHISLCFAFELPQEKAQDGQREKEKPLKYFSQDGFPGDLCA